MLLEMEFKEAERIVIAKPVASRPSCSSFRSFSELLAGAINVSPPKVFPETAIAAIRPKTVRLKPMINHSAGGVVSSQGEISGTAACYSSDKVLEPESKSSVVYKPLAKIVSKTTASLLANLGNFDINQQKEPAQVDNQIQNADQAKQAHLISKLHQKFSSLVETNQTIESSKMAVQNLEKRAQPPIMNGDRLSYDGYNWRKYGQKQVKGSTHPRSYYKCTYPNCPVKKKVERSFEGQLAEIVYKGEHNHSKPQPPKRHLLGAQGQGVSHGISQNTTNQWWSKPRSERTEGSEGRTENQNEVGLSNHLLYLGKAIPYGPAYSNRVGTPDNSCGRSGDCEEESRGMGADDNEHKCKRRKNENQSNEVGIQGEHVQEPPIAVQSSTDSEILSDGFRWRKYGQKVVKGNPHPRCYYRCTNAKCNVRKYVERASDDPRAFISTYEGKHNHDMPVARKLNPAASHPDSLTSTEKAKP